MSIYLSFVVISAVAALAVTLIYLVLRIARSVKLRQQIQSPSKYSEAARDNDAVGNAHNHCWWVAVIALFFSGAFSPRPTVYEMSPQLPLGEEPTALQFNADSWMANNFVWAALVLSMPMLALGIVYVIAQFSWPRPVGAVRTATLERRSFRSLLPLKMSMLFAVNVLIFLGLAISCLWIPASTPKITYEGDSIVSTQDGFAPGWFMAATFGISILVLVLAVSAAIAVIITRRIIPGLKFQDDSIIRRIDINRLLRWAVLLAASTSGTLWVATWGRTTFGVDLVAIAIWLLTAVLAIGFFRSPRIMPATPEKPHLEEASLEELRPGSMGYVLRWQQLASSGTTAVGFIAIVAALFTMPSVFAEFDFWKDVTPAYALIALLLGISVLPLLFLVAVEARFAVISRGERPLRRHHPRIAVTGWVIIGAVLLIAICALAITAGGFPKVALYTSWALIAANLLLTALTLALILTRRSYFTPTDGPGQRADQWLRSASIVRVLRISVMTLILDLLPLTAVRLEDSTDPTVGPNPIVPSTFDGLIAVVPFVIITAVLVVIFVRVPALDISQAALRNSWHPNPTPEHQAGQR